jgi:hypothetical protein
MAVKNKDEFQSKYGAPTSPDAQVLIGMKSGRAVYGSELDATDTKGSNVINNTPSQNQAIMDDMFKEMGRSGGMYNPSSKDIVAAERMSPITAVDGTITKRADGKEMIGAESQQAANMRESSAGDARFLQTLSRLNARPNRTSATEPTQAPPPDLQKIAEESRAREASPFTTGPVRWPIGQSPPPSVQDFGGLALSKPQAGSNKPSIFEGRDVTNMPFSERQLWDKNVPPNITGVDSNGLLISNEIAYGGRDKTKDNAWIEDYYKKNPPNLTGFQPANDNGVVLKGLLTSSNK